MITSNILQRIFFVRVGNSTGTAFTVDISHRQYLVTAKHVVEGVTNGHKPEVFHENIWKPLDNVRVWFPDGDNDLALIPLRKQLSPSAPITVARGEGYGLSQQCYFLGFPFGLKMDSGTLNNGYPLPFVKSAIVSSFIVSGEVGDVIFLDGINNPGFSGGPVVTVDSNHHCSVIGVISGYRAASEPVLINGQDSGLTYSANTGLIAAYGMTEILEEACKSMDGAHITF